MKRQMMFPMFDAVSDGSGGGMGQQGNSNAGAAGAGAGAAGVTGAQGDGQQGNGSTGTGQGNPGKQFTYNEDRTDWIPRHRLNEVSRKAQDYERQLQEAQRRIEALAGVSGRSQQDPQLEEVREAFKNTFPHLAKLDDRRIDRLLKLAEQSDQIEETTNHYWRSQGQKMTDALAGKLAEELGVEQLSPRQKSRFQEFYVNTLNRDFARSQAEGRPSELLKRHEAGDQTLIEELAKEFVEDFVEPVRRRATAANVNRVNTRVPNGRPASNVSTNSKPKIDFTNEQAVEDAAVAAFAANGGSFRR
jgi:uncharacterized protein YeeX (DUF496 family)